MYTALINGKTMEFETKEDLISYFVAQDRRYAALNGAANYTPSVFRDVAMNPNDQRTVANMPAEFHSWMSEPEKVRRSVMIYDPDGRVVDIREWLPEFQAMLEQMLNPKYNWIGQSGARPKARNSYRVGKGLKQQKSLHEEFDEDELDEFVGNIPGNLLRKNHIEPESWHVRDNSRSWKAQSKCRKSWQVRSAQPSAKEFHMADWQPDVVEEPEEYDSIGQ